ncbi:MAG: hypothetical protein HXY39_18075 [Chloroflexi bacterium]|nr:hypothetical protein [Chloroflexota bacterium]
MKRLRKVCDFDHCSLLWTCSNAIVRQERIRHIRKLEQIDLTSWVEFYLVRCGGILKSFLHALSGKFAPIDQSEALHEFDETGALVNFDGALVELVYAQVNLPAPIAVLAAGKLRGEIGARGRNIQPQALPGQVGVQTKANPQNAAIQPPGLHVVRRNPFISAVEKAEGQFTRQRAAFIQRGEESLAPPGGIENVFGGFVVIVQVRMLATYLAVMGRKRNRIRGYFLEAGRAVSLASSACAACKSGSRFC